MPYRNRPDRRKASLYPTMAVLSQIGWSVANTDGQHMQVTFDNPVVWDGNPAAFRFWNVDDETDHPAVSAVRTAPNIIIFDIGAASPGTYVVTPQQPLSSIVGFNGALIVGSPGTFAV